MAENKFIQVIFRTIIIGVLILLGIWLLYYSFHLTYPFLFAWLLALLINPLVNLLEKRAKLPRFISVIVGILFLFGVVGGILTVIIIKIIDGFQYLSKVIPGHFQIFSIQLQSFFYESILPVWERGLGMFNNLEESQRNAFEENIQQIGLQFGTILGKIGQSIANLLSNFVGALPITLTALIFILIALFFISKDWYKLRSLFRKIIPAVYLKKVSLVITDLKSKLVGFLVAQLILISMTAVVVFIGLLILKVDQPLTLALIIGFVDLLPYLGTGTVFVPWIIYCLLTGDLFLGIGLTILYVVVIILRQLAEPKVLSSNLDLNPLATLISLFAGLQLFGFLGLIIGPVILVILVSLQRTGILKSILTFIKGETT